MSEKQATQETWVGSSSKQKPLQHMIVMTGGQPKIPKAYHLEGASNYGV
jgi:hypothetical protein